MRDVKPVDCCRFRIFDKNSGKCLCCALFVQEWKQTTYFDWLLWAYWVKPSRNWPILLSCFVLKCDFAVRSVINRWANNNRTTCELMEIRRMFKLIIHILRVFFSLVLEAECEYNWSLIAAIDICSTITHRSICFRFIFFFRFRWFPMLNNKLDKC